MRWLAVLALAVFSLPVVRADGLIYQLPEDGAWARFDMTMRNKGGPQEATFTISSVGQVDEGKMKCRWIEFKFVAKAKANEPAVILKVLIPEKSLAAGANPGAAMIRGWVDEGRNKPVRIKDLKDREAGPLALFLSGPFQNPKKLDKTAIENKALGKLECEGISGNVSFSTGRENWVAKVVNLLHDKAPYGLVQSTMTIKFIVGEITEDMTLGLTLIEIGKGAKTERPELK